MDKNIVKFNGGLGNQMFQQAFGRALQEKTGIQTFYDMSFFQQNYAKNRPYSLDIFALVSNPVTNIFEKLKLSFIWKFRKLLKNKNFLGLLFYSEPHFEYDNSLLTLKNSYIEGFFQTEKYFEDIENLIRKDFTFRAPVEGLNKELSEKMAETNSVSLHIRRGDYVQKKRYQNLYATCSLSYYKRAVEYISQRFENPILYIFSDDIDWVKENLKLPYECVYVTHNTGDKSYEDMRLMSLCKHNVIANSSFSWWGAWLNSNPDKLVIAPQKWFNDVTINQKDVIPQAWVRLEN